MIKVEAEREGYYKNQIRQVGEEFEIDSKEELGMWMKVLEEPEVKEVPVVVEEAPAVSKPAKLSKAADAISDLI